VFTYVEMEVLLSGMWHRVIWYISILLIRSGYEIRQASNWQSLFYLPSAWLTPTLKMEALNQCMKMANIYQTHADTWKTMAVFAVTASRTSDVFSPLLSAVWKTGREPLNTAVAEIQKDRRQQVRDRTDRSLAADKSCRKDVPRIFIPYQHVTRGENLGT
jgi:hypothetical protein